MKLNSYLYSQLSITFFPIFLGLYFITSIVFLVKISSLTSMITMNFYELFTMYSYVVPQILFYTMPVSFFISLVITLSKLSSEYELTVITSFGLNPVNILKIFLPITVLISVFLLVTSLGLIPKTKYLTKQFLEVKQKEANFNIKAGEFGQKFGEWLVFVGNKDDKEYENLKLFKTDKKNDQFIISEKAILNLEKGVLNFNLIDGNAYIIDEKELNEINYKHLYINDAIANSKLENFTTSYEYWKSNIEKKVNVDDFTFSILTSIFPLISLFLVITFGYYNPRYEKSRAVLYSLSSIVFYYVFAKTIGDKILLNALYIIPILWISITYYLYSKTIKKEY